MVREKPVSWGADETSRTPSGAPQKARDFIVIRCQRLP